MELAVLQLHKQNKKNLSVVYLCPTKALCGEVASQWRVKFNPLKLKVVECTGDTVDTHITSSCNILVATPEKWDSLQRNQCRFHPQLLLIDEVHLLNEQSRGHVLECVVSRVNHKSQRVVAVSATVPNAADVAAWLRNAKLLQFDQSARPQPLRQSVIGYQYGGNAYGFDVFLNK